MGIMLIAIDIGGTKTLVASVNKDSQVVNKIKFPSPKNYSEWLEELKNNINQLGYDDIDFIAIGCAGTMDRDGGIIKNSPNLGWVNTPLTEDVSSLFGGVTTIVENDANLAGLSEAHALDDINQRVMYVTFSTGVGTGFVINGVLSRDLLDSEGGNMVFPDKDGSLKNWESLAAGRTIVEKYSKRASELDDPSAWDEITKNMAYGIVACHSVFLSDTVVVGGGVGTYFEKFGDKLKEHVKSMIDITGVIRCPEITGAKRAEEAVMLGCIIMAQQYEQRQ